MNFTKLSITPVNVLFCPTEDIHFTLMSISEKKLQFQDICAKNMFLPNRARSSQSQEFWLSCDIKAWGSSWKPVLMCFCDLFLQIWGAVYCSSCCLCREFSELNSWLGLIKQLWGLVVERERTPSGGFTAVNFKESEYHKLRSYFRVVLSHEGRR